MTNKILITDIDNLIGKRLVSTFSMKDYQITCFTRDSRKTASEFPDLELNLIELDITDIKALKTKLEKLTPELIINLNLNRIKKKINSLQTILDAVEQLILCAIKNKARFIQVMPIISPTKKTNFRSDLQNSKNTVRFDSYFEYVTFEINRIIMKYILYNLDAIVIKYMTLYGDFRDNLIWEIAIMIKRNQLFLSTSENQLQLCYLEDLIDIIKKTSEGDYNCGATVIASDLKPVSIYELADKIHQFLKATPFPESKIKKERFYQFYLKIMKFFRPEFNLPYLLEDTSVSIKEDQPANTVIVRKSATINVLKQLLPFLIKKLGD